ncbi:MAG: hypothetical protein QME70_12170 [Bacillota bacterium]|nr:hypothetical protein [Bacillota bacterium]
MSVEAPKPWLRFYPGSGSASLPGEVQARFEELTGGRLVEGYGLSEASALASRSSAVTSWPRTARASAM